MVDFRVEYHEIRASSRKVTITSPLSFMNQSPFHPHINRISIVAAKCPLGNFLRPLLSASQLYRVSIFFFSRGSLVVGHFVLLIWAGSMRSIEMSMIRNMLSVFSSERWSSLSQSLLLKFFSLVICASQFMSISNRSILISKLRHLCFFDDDQV